MKSADASEKKRKGPVKKGEVRNPEGRNGFSTGLQPFHKRAEHYGQKFKPSEIIAIANDPTRWDEFPHWDVVVLKRMAAMINGNKEEREEVKTYLDRKEGKPVERKEMRIIKSFGDLSEEELAALAWGDE